MNMHSMRQLPVAAFFGLVLPIIGFFWMQDAGAWMAGNLVHWAAMSELWVGPPSPTNFAVAVGHALGPIVPLLLAGVLFRLRLTPKWSVATTSLALAVSAFTVVRSPWIAASRAWPADTPITLQTLYHFWPVLEEQVWLPHIFGAACALFAAAFGWRLFTMKPRSFEHTFRTQPERDPTGTHQANWMSMAEARRLFRAPAGVVLGEAYMPHMEARGIASVLSPSRGGSAPLLRAKPTGHLLTVGPAGSGKSSCYSIPTLLDWPHSVVVLDPSSELHQACAEHRASRLGRRVLRIDPSDHETAGFNALAWIRPDSSSIVQDVKQVLGWFQAQRDDAHEDMFELTGQSLIRTLLLHLVYSSKPGDGTLEQLVQLASQGEPELRDFLASIGKSNSPAAKSARRLAGTSAEETFSGIVANAAADIDFLDNPAYDRIVSAGRGQNTFTLDELLDGQTDIFINIPLTTIDQDPGLARVIVGSFLSAVMRRGEALQDPLLFLLDEMPRLGRMVALESALTTMRKFKVVLWAMAQDLGQLERAYGREGVRSWTDSCYIQSYVGIEDAVTREFLSKAAGSFTIKQGSASETEGEAPQRGGSHSNSFQRSMRSDRRNLIEPDEVRRMVTDKDGRPDEQIILVRGRAPIRCGLAKYYRRPDMKHLAAQTSFTKRA